MGKIKLTTQLLPDTEIEISCYGQISQARSSGTVVSRLADGSLSKSDIYKKRVVSVELESVPKADMDSLLEHSHRVWYAEKENVEALIRIVGEISYSERRRFPGFFNATFTGEET